MRSRTGSASTSESDRRKAETPQTARPPNRVRLTFDASSRLRFAQKTATFDSLKKAEGAPIEGSRQNRRWETRARNPSEMRSPPSRSNGPFTIERRRFLCNPARILRIGRRQRVVKHGQESGPAGHGGPEGRRVSGDAAGRRDSAGRGARRAGAMRRRRGSRRAGWASGAPPQGTRRPRKREGPAAEHAAAGPFGLRRRFTP